MKVKYNDYIHKHAPYSGNHVEICEAESEKEAEEKGFYYSSGGGNSLQFDITLEEIFKAMLKRFRILYIPDIRDMMHEEVMISTDEDLINKMIEVANEAANEIFRERLPKELLALSPERKQTEVGK